MSIYQKKSSFTGWFGVEHETQRFFNLCKVQSGSLQYIDHWGLDWRTWLNPRINFSAQGMSSYITQRATNYGIGISSISSRIEQHRLKVQATVNGLTPKATSNTTGFFEVSI